MTMNRNATALCVAAALGCAVSLGAQSTTTTTTASQRPMTADKAHDITVTGCLSKGADGNFILTNARESKGGDVATTTAPGAATTAGTTGSAVPPATSTTATEPAGSGASSAMVWSLVGVSDL